MGNFSKYNMIISEKDAATIASQKAKAIRGNGNGNKEYDYPEVVEGIYIAQIDSMCLCEEYGQIKYKLMLKLIDGVDDSAVEFINQWPGRGNPKIPYKISLSGTQNDANCIGCVIGLLNRFADTNEIDFDGNFDRLAEIVYEIYEEVKDKYAYEVKYTPEKFYRISILSVLEEDDGSEESEHPVKEEIKEETDSGVKKIVRPEPMESSMPKSDTYIPDYGGFMEIDDEEGEDLPF